MISLGQGNLIYTDQVGWGALKKCGMTETATAIF